MRLIEVSNNNNKIRERFFQVAFGNGTGYIAVAAKDRQGLRQAFFQYPKQLPNLLEWVNSNFAISDLYFCPQLFSEPKRQKGYVKECPNAWADFDNDSIVPEGLPIKPTISLETSKGHFHCLWCFSEPKSPQDTENLSRRLAYTFGADMSGWDLTQLLRIPLTYNFKHKTDTDIPIVELQNKRFIPDLLYEEDAFTGLQELPEFNELQDVEFPISYVELKPEDILQKYSRSLLPNVYALYTQSPDEDWSTPLWALECALLEAGMSMEEAFAVVMNSAVNKYRRDKRTETELWKEVCKAKAVVDTRIAGKAERKIGEFRLLTEQEQEHVKNLPNTFIESYVQWASHRTDAFIQYHEAGAAMILSCLLAECVRIPTSFGVILPNLWIMILGNTTVTRKSTATDMAVDLLDAVYTEAMLATDGSVEGIMSEMSRRPGRTSLFYRDEFSGLLEGMRRKDYYAGMMEALTKMYDGRMLKRVLRKETVEVRDPIFILFCGGISSRIIELLTPEHIINGFIPRFLFVKGEADPDKFLPLGPANGMAGGIDRELLETLSNLRGKYNAEVTMMLGEQKLLTKRVWDAKPTEEAWDTYNRFDKVLLAEAMKTDKQDYYIPSMDRLAKSGLKLAALLAAARQDPTKTGYVEISQDDVLRAFYYIDRWKEHTIYVIENAGKTASEKSMQRAYELIRKGKDARSSLMTAMHLSANQADIILDTLEQRGMITRTRFAKKEKLHAIV